MKIVLGLALLLSIFRSTRCEHPRQAELEQLQAQLARIDATILLRTKSLISLPTEKKYSLKFDGYLSIEVIDAPKIPSRKENSYPLLLRTNHTFYNIAGEEMFKVPAKEFMVSSGRNDFTHIAQRTNAKEWTVSQLEVQGRYCSLKPLVTLQEASEEQATAFMSLMYKGKRVFVLGTQRGNLVIYNKQGAYERTLEITNGPIEQLERTSANLFVRSKNDINSIGITNDRPPTKCQLPDDQMLEVAVSNDHGTSKFYVRTPSSIFVYEVRPDMCKPKQILNIPQGATMHILAGSVIANKNLSALVFNSTQGYQSYWTNLHKPSLQDAHYNLCTFKKAEGVFGVAYISYNVTANQTELVLYQYQLEGEADGEGFSLRSFKAPIFLLSIGAVFYYTFIAKKNKPTSQQLEELDAAEQKDDEQTKLSSRQLLRNKNAKTPSADPIRDETKRFLPKLGGNLTQEEFNRIVMEKYLLARQLDKKAK